MVAIMLGADNGFFYAGQVMHFSSPFTVFLIYHKHTACLQCPFSYVLYLSRYSPGVQEAYFLNTLEK